ncbi:MFS transporter [bacterium SCSIO 12741]|nr:MFS transporter [bacterium SCSIO 12741]
MTKSEIVLGLKENWKQFTLLVIVNAFVGGMVGLERSIFPEFAESEFGIKSHTAILTFIIAFGVTKALANYFTGKLANKWGRRNLLIIGMALAIPVPLILMSAPYWYLIIMANILLGASQGLAWSSTVVMKIDLVGEKDRGLAMGLNEFAGYLAVGLVAFLSAYIAHEYGVTPYPFYLGLAIAVIGFLLAILWVKDTHHHVKLETTQDDKEELDHVFINTTFSDKALSSITQAGMVNNLNDGMIWGLLPIWLLSMSYSTDDVGLITAIYPAVWGIGQLFTGKMADLFNKKSLLFWGMLVQGLAILLIPSLQSMATLITVSVLLGLGTALVYPTFLAAIAQYTSAQQRAESIGVFRLWRDLGYAIGALLSGIIADAFGLSFAIMSIGVLTLISSLIIRFRMPASRK